MNEYLTTLSYYLPELLKALRESGIMMFYAILSAVFLGVPLGTALYLISRRKAARSKILSISLNRVIDIVRSFPFLLLVIALIPFTRLVAGTAFGTKAAAVPLSFVAAALSARLVEQTLFEVPEEVLELAEILGAGRRQLIFHFLYVEARSGIVLSLTSVIISMVSYSTVMGVVGGGGIGDFALRYGYQRYEYALMYTAIILMIVSVSLIQIGGNYLAKRLDKKH
ncbi:ABC transporter permease subunit [Enterococcus sp. BWB1-3]|uniref:methionine ABC transporter permease n=1 Tax=unclassified Enterococcus TaxID=2608891 RepID=UPI0019238AAE|nr:MULTISPECIES: ABC transporter permease subunit [unclassified Enterococcus]MBL1228829.1 ABC transporter permease subunit [Enterococcus sp. BWB1-3]MCB5951629.1 ABC transporter permease subunit [Enterococcus sp. BWT-B8]MCB5954721.1 ABC transporter permease subunit [Enterococcus sp. CWB-B31]